MSHFDYTVLVPVLAAFVGYLIQSPRGQTLNKIVKTVFPAATDADIVKAVTVLGDANGRTAILDAIRNYGVKA